MLESVEKICEILLDAFMIDLRKKGERADRENAGDGLKDDPEISAVITASAQDGKQSETAIRRLRESARFSSRMPFQIVVKRRGEELAEIKKLEFFGGFLAAADLAQIIKLAPRGSLPEILGVTQETRSGFLRETPAVDRPPG